MKEVVSYFAVTAVKIREDRVWALREGGLIGLSVQTIDLTAKGIRIRGAKEQAHMQCHHGY